MTETKIPRKRIVIALGVICVIMVACLSGVIAFYTFVLNDKNNTIASLRSQVSELNSNVTNLQNQLNTILNRSSYIEDMVMSDPSAWFNKTVIVEGNLSASYEIATYPPGLLSTPFFAQLSSDGHSISVWNLGIVNQMFNVPKQVNSSSQTYTVSRYVRIYGVVESWEGAIVVSGPPAYMYYINPETVEPL
jgi:outer membrane murein-binding lipoprotein Lpp